MKKLLKMLSLGGALLWCAAIIFVGCTADYDEFGESPYHQLSEIHFEEEGDGVQVYPSEHKIIVQLSEPDDSLETWDSVTVSSIDMSPLASLYLVESKVVEFPSDSLALDSLAHKLAYSEKKIKEGSRIRIPTSKKIYVMAVAENGNPSLWLIEFSIPEAEPTNKESKEENSEEEKSEADDSGNKDSEEQTAEEVKSSEKGLSLTFENQVRLDTLEDTLSVKFPVGTEISKVKLSAWNISEGASVSPEPESISEWEEGLAFKVTAEDGSTAEWVVHFTVATATEVLNVSAKGETQKALIDEDSRSITVYLPDEESLKSVDLESLEVSEGATHDLDLSGLDLSKSKTFTVATSDKSSESLWTISAQVFKIIPPSLESIAVGAGKVKGSIDQETGTVFFNMDYGTDLDLRSLKVQSVDVSEGATISEIKVGTVYNFSKAMTLTVANAQGDKKTYTLQAGYQYPGSDFNTWVNDDFGNQNDIEGWDNGNNDAISATKTLTVNEEKQVIKMESKDAKILGIGRFASGNMLVAYFNPKAVSTLKMTGYDDGNELIDFGRPFYGRPKYVEFDVKYEGKGDSCDLYVVLENRSRTTNEGKNQYRASSDVNTMVASAWYRATTVESKDDPDVVSITDAFREGYKTIRLAFKYGIPDEASPIYNSSLFSKALKNSAGIDNHVEKTDSPDDFDVTHIRVVMASSALGNLYEGTVGATLWADEMRLIY